MNPYVIVDWRPYDLPTVTGPFHTEEEADKYARKAYEIDTDDEELPDGIIVRQLESVWKQLVE